MQVVWPCHGFKLTLMRYAATSVALRDRPALQWTYTLLPRSRCFRANSTPRCRFSRVGTPVRSTVLSVSCSTPAASHSCIRYTTEHMSLQLISICQIMIVSVTTKHYRWTHLSRVAEIFRFIHLVHGDHPSDVFLLHQLQHNKASYTDQYLLECEE